MGFGPPHTEQMTNQDDWPASLREAPAALVVAHPGHELRVFGWLRLARPTVFVLTDGSGRSGRSRLASTTTVLRGAGAARGCIYGRLTDLALYDAILALRLDLFTSLAEELATAFHREKVGYVVADAGEGYNPAHDACRMVVDTAVELARRRLDHRIESFDFPVVGDPNAVPFHRNDGLIRIQLDVETLREKLSAAAAYTELARDVDGAISSFGEAAFKVECIRPVDAPVIRADPFDRPPYYEEYGERQVAAGYYSRVLRLREHMAPLADGLNRYLERRM